jgi:hypothetical protein
MQWMLGRSVPRQIDLAQYSDEVIEKVAKTVQGSAALRALSDSERPNTPCNIGSWDRRGRVLRASMSLVVIGFAASVSTAAAQYLPPQPPPVGYPPPAYLQALHSIGTGGCGWRDPSNGACARSWPSAARLLARAALVCRCCLRAYSVPSSSDPIRRE